MDQKEKASSVNKAKQKLLKLLPKAAHAVAVSFQNMPFSPRRLDPHRPKAKAFSGPLGPMVPAQARRNLATQEPTSPKVSCMGQIKYKKKHPSLSLPPNKIKPAKKKSKKKASAAPMTRVESTPSLGGMRKFASSREALANFDWAQVAPEEDRGFCSDGYSDDDDDASGVLPVPRKEINLWKRRTMNPPTCLHLDD